METKDITPKQYAEYRGCSVQNIRKYVELGKPLEFVLQIKRWSRFYTFEVPATLSAESFTTDKIKYKKKKKPKALS